MTTKVVINEANEFKLLRWNNAEFISNLTLLIEGIDLPLVKSAFSNIDKLEIFQGGFLVATFTCFNTFDSINYLGNVFSEDEQTFTDGLCISLSRTNIVDQVQRLDNQINPVIDVDSMDLDEYKEYKLGLISEVCTASIYSGDKVTLSDGTAEMFSFTDKDQMDLQSLSSIAMMDPEIELPWHSNGNPCKFYSGIDIILIYQTLNMKLLRETTVCNALNILINNAETKEEVDKYYWGCDLPIAERERVQALITRMEAIISNIMDGLIQPEEIDE